MMTMEPRRGMQVQKSLLLDEQKNYEPNKGPEVLCGSTRTFLVTSFSPKKSCAPACAPAGFSKTTCLVTFECVPLQRREATETKQECHGCFDSGIMRRMRRRDGGQINEIRQAETSRASRIALQVVSCMTIIANWINLSVCCIHDRCIRTIKRYPRLPLFHLACPPFPAAIPPLPCLIRCFPATATPLLLFPLCFDS